MNNSTSFALGPAVPAQSGSSTEKRRDRFALPGVFRGAGVLIGLAVGSLCAAIGLAASLQQVGW